MLFIFIPICIVIISLILIMSKANYTLVEPEERVDVLFTASLPQELQAASCNGGALHDILTVGVYDSGGNVLMRKNTQIDGSKIDFKINLAKRYTYNIVLWTHYGASNTNNITDMKYIKMLVADDVEDFNTLEQLNDFYTTHEEVSVNQSSTHSVDLICPLSQNNQGPTKKYAKATLKIFGIPSSLHLFTKEMSRAERPAFDHRIKPDTSLITNNLDCDSAATDYLFASESELAFESEASM